MAVYFNGTLVDSGNFQFDGITPDKVYFNGAEVWTNKAPAGSQTFTSSGTFTVPQGYTEVTICMCGGGGSGASTNAYEGQVAGGGSAGQVISQSVTVTSGQEISVVIGGGGGAVGGAGVNGSSGGSSSFAAITASGGAGGILNRSSPSNPSYNGVGSSRTTCGGTFNDGLKYHGGFMYAGSDYYSGGQAGAFGNGGNGATAQNTYPQNGGIGAGGGGHSHYRPGGSGGRGQCIVSWS